LRSFNHAPETERQNADGSGTETETALHSTRLRYLERKKFCKRIFAQSYPPARAAAGLLRPAGFCTPRRDLQRFAKIAATAAAN